MASLCFLPAVALALSTDDSMLSIEDTSEWQLNTTFAIEESKREFLTPPKPPELTLKERIEAGDTSTTTIALFIRETALNASTSPSLLLAVAVAESGLKWDAKNKLSTASGIYQYLNSTFTRYCSPDLSKKNDPILQTECATRMIAGGGISHWEASKPTWSKLLVKYQNEKNNL